MENPYVQYFIGLALTAYPTWRIIKRSGLNQLWSALLLLPGIGSLIILAILAFSDWPLNSKEGA